MIYDDKTSCTISSGEYILISTVDEPEDVVFKASFVVVNNLHVEGRVKALFDLIVLGDIECDDLDIKGKLICLGNCKVSRTIVVQDNIWANDIRATEIICHDDVFAQGIDVDLLKADGNILIGKTLAVESKAETIQKILCGETAYGAGKIIARMVMTAEELDLDEGETALETPYVYMPSHGTSQSFDELKEYVASNDYKGYINTLVAAYGTEKQALLSRALKVFCFLNEYYPNRISEINDVSVLLWLIEMISSGLFSAWPQLTQWYKGLLAHFNGVIHGEANASIANSTDIELKEGCVVSHVRYGQGIVKTLTKKDNSSYTKIQFEEYGEKEFVLPISTSKMRVVSQNGDYSTDIYKNFIKCSAETYNEWLVNLLVLNSNRVSLGDDLYALTNDLLFSQIGLKAKFVHDRMHEKGWE